MDSRKDVRLRSSESASIAARRAGEVVEGFYKGISTSEVDTLAAETCAYMSQKHPDFSILAARIAVPRPPAAPPPPPAPQPRPSPPPTAFTTRRFASRRRAPTDSNRIGSELRGEACPGHLAFESAP